MMTSRLVSTPLWAAKRGLAAQAATASRAVAAGGNQDAQVSKADNGLTLISVDNGAPVATLGILVKAGARYEDYENLGASHALRVASGLAGSNFSSFAITRGIQQAGGWLTCVQGREHMLYATQVLRNKVDDAVDYLVDAACGQSFKQWELEPCIKRLQLDISEAEPSAIVNDLLHKAAYRSGLGNPLLARPDAAGSFTSPVLSNYFNKNFTFSRSALVGIGVDSATLQEYANLVNLENGQGPSGQSKYSGGEIRVDLKGSEAYVALAAEGPGGNNMKELLATLILQRVLGVGVNVLYGSGAGKLQKAVENTGAKVSALSFAYSDGGLIGANIVAPKDQAGKAVSAVAAALRSISVSKEELAAAKKSMLVEAYSITVENPMARVEDMGLQALITGQVNSFSQVPAMLESVSLGDVQAAAKKIASGKLSMGAYGNLSTVPYLDQL